MSVANDVNRMSRRVMAANAVVSLIPAEHNATGTNDDARLARLMERVGEVGYAYRTGTADIVDELLKVAATTHAWIDRLQEEAAR